MTFAFSAQNSNARWLSGMIQILVCALTIIWKPLRRLPLQKVLSLRGVDVFSPKETFRLAAREGLISNLKG